MESHQVTILEKIYGEDSWAAKRALKAILSEMLPSDVEVKLGSDSRKWVRVSLTGSGSEGAVGRIAGEFGTTKAIGDVEVGVTCWGKIFELGNVGYGVHVDIGIADPEPIDALLPLVVLRRQLSHQRESSIPKIVRNFGFVENLPLEIVIDDVDVGSRKVKCSLSRRQVERFRRWVRSGRDRIFVSGITRRSLKRAVGRAGHSRDVYAIRRLGLMEHALVCKYGTDGPGLLASIGPELKCKMNVFVSRTGGDDRLHPKRPS